jgi:hypothetical protein
LGNCRSAPSLAENADQYHHIAQHFFPSHCRCGALAVVAAWLLDCGDLHRHSFDPCGRGHVMRKHCLSGPKNNSEGEKFHILRLRIHSFTHLLVFLNRPNRGTMPGHSRHSHDSAGAGRPRPMPEPDRLIACRGRPAFEVVCIAYTFRLSRATVFRQRRFLHQHGCSCVPRISC